MSEQNDRPHCDATPIHEPATESIPDHAPLELAPSESLIELEDHLQPSRRTLITGFGAGLVAAPFLALINRPAWALDIDPAQHNPIFTLGVASGDPTERSVVIWTRLAPDPLDGGGMGAHPAPVEWRLASDPTMRRVLRRGVAVASARDGHALSVEVNGLDPDRVYYYQFQYRGVASRIGRTRTFPSSRTLPGQMRFAVASCQNYEAGFFAAWRDIATQELDFVVHTGDYIYENAGNPTRPAERRHNGGEIFTAEDYRNRYALYKLDPNLQDAHAAFPFILTSDDHEVDNNYAGPIPENDQTFEDFRRRRTAAYQVYRETMPFARSVRAREDSISLVRALRFGQLADLLVLDTRQFRSDQPCGDGLVVQQECDDMLDPAATMMGDDQEAWLVDRLRRPDGVWSVIIQQVMMMRWDLGGLLGPGLNFFNVDAWDGYQVARDRLMRVLAEPGVRNPVVLTGDIHSSWAADLKADFSDPSAPVVGAEFVCSGVTSTFGDGNDPLVRATLPGNPHIRFFDGLHRGYVLCTVTPERWRSDFRAVERRNDPLFTVPAGDVPVFTLASFGIDAGRPGVFGLA